MTTLDQPSAAQAAAHIRDNLNVDRLDIAVVLGSGWSTGADRLGEVVASCPLGDVPGFKKPVVAGHGGDLRIVRTAGGKIAAVFTGRTHYYEGRGAQAVVHGVRTAAELGASTLVLTNGCGGLVSSWAPGTVVALSDHINLTGDTPLQGATFIDMSEPYSRRLINLVHTIDPNVPEGVYVQFRGPQYETPAEVRMAGILGGQLVGMSTALETIAAREAGMEVLALSLVTNQAAGLSSQPLDHSEVIQAGRQAGEGLAILLAKIVSQL